MTTRETATRTYDLRAHMCQIANRACQMPTIRLQVTTLAHLRDDVQVLLPRLPRPPVGAEERLQKERRGHAVPAQQPQDTQLVQEPAAGRLGQVRLEVDDLHCALRLRCNVSHEIHAPESAVAEQPASYPGSKVLS